MVKTENGAKEPEKLLVATVAEVSLPPSLSLVSLGSQDSLGETKHREIPLNLGIPVNSMNPNELRSFLTKRACTTGFVSKVTRGGHCGAWTLSWF